MSKVEFPELYKNYSYSSYINFLTVHNLVIIEEDSIKITHLGKDFLKYIIEERLSIEKAF